MLEKIKMFLSSNKNITRTIGLLLIPILFIILIGQLDIFVTSVKIFILLLVFFYIIFMSFKALFPYVDFKSLYDKAVENSTSSAIVFGSLMIALVLLLTHILRLIFR